MSRRTQSQIFILFSIALLLGCNRAPHPIHAIGQPSLPPPPAGDVVSVAKVIDGDTFKTASGEKVRLLGVDTPELHHPKKKVQYFAKEAHAYLTSLIGGQKVTLTYDWQRRDKYGRLLAYVRRTSDGLFINAEIIRQGYGFAYTRFPFKYLEVFRQHERNAREKKLGLWK